MPRETFFKLPEKKRALICDVALDEFAEFSYEQASINRIVAKADIAKGSFYQYFEDKKDLFLFLMSMIAEEKIKYLSPVVSRRGNGDIFSHISELFLSGIRFANEHPRYAAIGNRLLAAKDSPIYSELKAESWPTLVDFLQPLIVDAVERGDVRSDIDIGLMQRLVASFNVIIVEYWSDMNPDGNYDAMADTVEAIIDILRNGIGYRETELQSEQILAR